jgi:hypothetical protein
MLSHRPSEQAFFCVSGLVFAVSVAIAIQKRRICDEVS